MQYQPWETTDSLYTVTPSVGSGQGEIAAASNTAQMGDTLEFTLTPAKGYHLESVSSSLSGSLDLEQGIFTTDAVTQSGTVTANFAPDLHTLKVKHLGRGTVTGNGIKTPFDPLHEYQHGTKTVLQAQGKEGYGFDSWENCDDPAGIECIMSMDADKKCLAVFKKIAEDPPGGFEVVGLPTDFSAAGATTIAIIGDTVTQFKYALDGGEFSEPIDAAQTASIDLSSLDEGEHKLSILAYQDGSWQPEEEAWTSTWVKDTTPPFVTGLSNSTEPVPSITWSWSATENATFRHAINQNSTWLFADSKLFNATAQAGLSEVNGTWYLHVQAKDQAGNMSPVRSVFAILAKIDPSSLAITEGWNLLGLSLAPLNGTTQALFSELKDDLHSIWTWEDAAWAVLLPNKSLEEMQSYIQAKGFSELSEIQGGQGFWVHAQSNCTLEVNGTDPQNTQTYASGWHLLSLLQNADQNVSEFVQSIPLSVVSLWKWDAGNWKVCLPGENDKGATYAKGKGFGVLENIEPGEGFWVNCK